MSIELPALPYAYDALAPVISQETMEFHHDKHHAAYVTNLNAAIKDTEVADWSAESLISNLSAVPDAIRGAVRNNAGGHVNHSLFWDLLTPGGASAPSGELATAITAAFGSFEALKEAVAKAGATRFGSGWAWLVTDGAGTLSVVSTANQDTPLMGTAVAGCTGTPILGIDVWEHAYYIDYRNARPKYLEAIWAVINWDKVAELYAAR
ncbi:MAG: superoxide dismutase [Armatimonadetes bacterium]|jgi:Fe-Mn family superoxide dismutase|nr:superoxide dismutase [Armatimonadota bacterium]